MGGLWAFSVGGLAMGVLMARLEWAYHWSQYLGMAPEECANYGGNGNAGPFAYTSWEFLLPYLAFTWVLAIAIEQALPSARLHRSSASYALRATLALAGSIVLSCWLPVGLALTCG